MRVTIVYDFSPNNIEKARRWAKERNKSYPYEKMLLADALESGIFLHDYVKLINITVKGEK